jgi:ribose-phosphate pyrophosphokinase
MGNALKIFTGRANPKLAEEICRYVKIPLGKAMVTQFGDGECRVKIEENVRGTDCFIVQPTCPPVNDNLMELLTMIDAFCRASARRITAVIPYYGYGRQDKKDEPRVPITAKLAADIITAAGTDRVLTMDLHAGQIQGFFKIPVDNLYATPVLLDYFRRKGLKKLVVISPDPGGVERARAFAKGMKASLALVDKRRPAPNLASVMNIIGEVEGRNVIILDDLIDTGGTITGVVKALKENGSRDIFAACSHGVLSGLAAKEIEQSELRELVITNSINLLDDKKCKKITVLSIAKLLGEAIKRIHKETSVSTLFV